MKLLFITASRIGDAVISTGLLNHMICTYPDVKVTVAAAPLTLPLFEGVPYLERLVPIVKRPLHRHWIDLWKECRQEKWDIIIDIRGSVVSYFLKASRRYIWKSSSSVESRVNQLGVLLDVIPPPAPYLWLPKNAISKAEKLMKGHKSILALAPAANWIGKQWPTYHFISLIQKFLKNYDAQIAVFGAPQEREMIAPILSAIPKGQCIDLIGKLSLLEIAACIKQCGLFLGNDSGLMHISSAIGTPTIGLFGPSDDRLYGPYSAPNQNIHHVVRTPESLEELKKLPSFSFNADRTFMDNLKPETVYGALEFLWNKHVG